MKDWKAIARAQGLELSGGELDPVTAPLDALEDAFRPLVRGLTPDAEPAVVFDAEEDIG